jgi:hypothetical protein
MLTDWWRFLLPLAVVLVWFAWTRWFGQVSPLHTAAGTATVQRLLKPRTPADCPACRQFAATATDKAAPPTRVRPWREVKSRRCAPKRIDTAGLRLPQAHMCLLPYHRREGPCPGRRWSGGERRTNSDIPLPGVSDDLQRPP